MLHAVQTFPLLDCSEEPQSRQALLEQVFLRSPTPMVITDTEGLICCANPALEQASGYAQDELRGHSTRMLRSPLQSADFYRLMWASLRSRRRWQGEIWNRRKDGRIYREWLSITALLDRHGDVSHYLGQFGATAHEHPAEGPQHGGDGIDPITAVLNRSAFIAACNRLGSPGSRVAMLTLDLDRFTDLNEQFGLGAGDRLLRQVALRCTQVAAASGGHSLVGRVGADEFALAWLPAEPCTDDATAQTLALALAQRLHHSVAATYDLGVGRRVSVSAQVGLAVLGSGQNEAAEALLHASAARHDTQLGPGAVRRYEAHDGLRQLTRALREALHEDRIQIALQPKVDLRTGALLGVEALARWTLENGQEVPPAEFIALAERQGLIAELGDSVLDQALRWAAAMSRQGPAVPVAVNFSAPQFHRRDLAARVQHALLTHGLAPDLLELELTESILLGDVDSALATLASLREMGLALSIDDFGTGYSSLSYLCRFPVTRVKLDRSFIHQMVSDGRTLALVRSVIELAHQLGLVCVAEGIETEDQLALLRELGCDEGQGYLFARPLPADAASDMLLTRWPWTALFARTSRGR